MSLSYSLPKAHTPISILGFMECDLGLHFITNLRIDMFFYIWYFDKPRGAT
jgi:hypothetical protein